jgi:hypothetical protein
MLADREDQSINLAEPFPELSVALVSDQQGTIVHVSRNGEAYEIEFSNPSRVDTVLAREIQAVVRVPPGS